MSAVFDKIEGILTDAYSVSNYVDLMNEILDDLRIVAPNSPRKEFTNFSSHIESSTHVGNYTSPDGKKIIVMAVELKSQTYVENSRSTQRSYAKKLIENANADAALVAFYTSGDPRWRLSFVRLDYEMKIENGKLKTAENMTPARRYSFLVGKDEPCHTAIERFRLFLEKHNANPNLDDLENAFSVEAVTREFFELYCEKYHQLREALEKNADFVEEAKLHNYTSAQFAKKLMGQIVFLYFLQKKGWLGVSAWPRQLSVTDYRKALFAHGAKSHELIPVVYQQVDDNTYRINAAALNALSNEDEEFLSTCVRGEPWGSGPHNFMRRLFETSDRKGANFYDDYLEPLFYEALNVNRGDQGYDPALHCRIPFLSGGLFEPIDGYDWKHNHFAIPNDIFSNKKDHKDRLADGILDIFDRYNFTMSEDEPLEREVAIDPEMLGKVFENLLDVNDRKSKGAFYTPREIVHYMCQESLINYLTNTMKVSEMAIRDFILYGDFMKDEDASVLKRAEKGDSYALWVSEELYELNPDGTVKTDRMKEFDKALQDVRVADPAVGSGAFPLGMLNEIVRARQNITTYMDITQKIIDPKGASREIRYRRINDRSARQLKYDTIRNCIFAVDIEPSAVDIAQLRLWLALVIDDEIDPNAISALDGHRNPLPLPNLECNILCGNSLIDEFEGIKLINESDIIGTAGKEMQVNLYQSAFDATLQRLIDKQEELFRCTDTGTKEQLLQDIDALRDEVIMSQLRGQASADQLERYFETKSMASKPFILWQLDFARVFREKGGFDIVIGNPPYVQVSKLPDASENYKKFLKRRYNTSGGRLNLFIFMIHLSLELANLKGTVSFIIPNTIRTQEYYRDTREQIIQKHTLMYLIDFEGLQFQNAIVENVTLMIEKDFLPEKLSRVFKWDQTGLHHLDDIPRSVFQSQKNYTFTISSNQLIDSLITDATPLNQYCNINQAIALKGDKTLSVKNEYEEGLYRLLDGRNISKYGIKWTGAYLDYDIDRIHSCKRKDIFECPEKLLFRRVSSTLIATYDCNQYFALNTLVVITAKTTNINLKYILALINSKLFNYIYKNKFKSSKTVFSEIQARSVGELPIRISNMYENQIIDLVDAALRKREKDYLEDIDTVLQEIDSIVYQIYGLSEQEIALIENDNA